MMPRTHATLSWLALVLIPAGSLAGEVYVVRSTSSTLSHLSSTLSTKVTGDAFCSELRCVVTVTTAAQKTALTALAKAETLALEPLPDAHKILFQNATFDGEAGTYTRTFPGHDEFPAAGANGLFVVMFKAPPDAGWLNEIIRLGGVPVAFMPSMSYIVYGPRNLRVQLTSKNYVFRVEEAPAGIKRSGLDEPGDVSNAEITTLVSIVNVSSSTVKDRIAKSHGGTPPTSRRDGGLETLEARMPVAEALALSRLPEVVHIAKSRPAAPSDERSNRIIAGGQPGTGSPAWPAAIGANTTTPRFWDQYLANLTAQIPTFDLSNQVIGFLDTGVDDGLWECGLRCPPYFRANGADNCRLVYTNDITPDFFTYTAGQDSNANRRATDYYYHGTLTTSIAAGFAGAESSGRDSQGYAFTQGVAQGARVAVMKMLAPTPCDPTANLVGRRISDAEGHLNLSNASQLFRYSYVALTGTSPLPDNSPAGPGALLFNHSWNIQASPSTYDDLAALFDQVGSNGVTQFTFLYPDRHEQAIYSPLMPSLNVVSAGNCPASSYCGSGDLVQSPGTAKNVLTVGATHTDNQESFAPSGPAGCAPLAQGVDYRAVAPYSRGWNGGRVKPDLVAPGSRAYGRRSSAAYFCGDACNSTLGSPANTYKWSSGTSFAAPVVTGAAALVSEWLSALLRNGSLDPVYWPSVGEYSWTVYPLPSLLRAVLIGTAKDLCPADNCTLPKYSPSDPTRVMRSAPDQLQGWGALSLASLFRSPSTYFFGNVVRVRTGIVWSKTLAVVDPSRPVTITLAWQDEPSVPAPDPDSVLRRDLDLTVMATGSDGVIRTYYGNLYGTPANPSARDGYSLPNPSGPVYDRKNNVERVTIRPSELPAAGGSITVSVARYYVPPVCPPGQFCPTPLYADSSVFVDNAH